MSDHDSPSIGYTLRSIARRYQRRHPGITYRAAVRAVQHWGRWTAELGTRVDGQPATVDLDDFGGSQILVVAGMTGAGKTSLLSYMVGQWDEVGARVLVIDDKGSIPYDGFELLDSVWRQGGWSNIWRSGMTPVVVLCEGLDHRAFEHYAKRFGFRDCPPGVRIVVAAQTPSRPRALAGALFQGWAKAFERSGLERRVEVLLTVGRSSEGQVERSGRMLAGGEAVAFTPEQVRLRDLGVRPSSRMVSIVDRD